jgi:hypothetical protein
MRTWMAQDRMIRGPALHWAFATAAIGKARGFLQEQQ